MWKIYPKKIRILIKSISFAANKTYLGIDIYRLFNIDMYKKIMSSWRIINKRSIVLTT